MDASLILYTTWPDAETAQSLAAEAIAERLAACANIMAPSISIYRWKGAVEQTAEVVMLLKTTVGAGPALRDLVVQRHPYEIPCVLAVDVDTQASADAFRQWVASEVTARDDPSSNKDLR